MLVDAPLLKGEAAADVQEAVNASQRDATDAIERNAIPRQYERAVKTYFDRLAGLFNSESETAGDGASDSKE